MFGLLVSLLLTGMPLAFVTLLVALIFALGWFGPMSIPLITSRVYSFVMNFVFVSVPMFVLMAAILDRSGIARDLFDAMKLFAGRIRGGVAVQTVFVSIILAAMSGIIGGEIVLLGLIALPQMLRLGYNRNLAIGVVCAGRVSRHHDPALDRPDNLRPDRQRLNRRAFHRRILSRLHAGDVLCRLHPVQGLFHQGRRARRRSDPYRGNGKAPASEGAGAACPGRISRPGIDLWRHRLGHRGIGRRGGRRRPVRPSCAANSPMP